MEQFGPPEIAHHEIMLKTKIGHGRYGEVWEGYCRGKEVAVKIPIFQKYTEEELLAVRKEIDTMRRLFHPHIVLLLGGCTYPNFQRGETIKIVMELCSKNLEQLLEADRREKIPDLTLKKRIQHAKDIALGLDWLHEINSMVHKDLKSANILIDTNGRAKVSDFGFTQIKSKSEMVHRKEIAGTPYYMAPELMMGLDHDGFKADIYAYGIILWEIITSEKPFREYTKLDVFKKAVVEQFYRPPIPKDLPNSLINLLQLCWHPDPQSRPSFSIILQMLNESLLDVSITDPVAREWWKFHFLNKTELSEFVPYSEFCHILVDDLGYQDHTIKEAMRIIGCEMQNNLGERSWAVTTEHFDKVVHTFGRFFLFSPEGQIAMQEILNYLSQPGHFLEISRQMAEGNLNKSSIGTWLVRLRNPLDEKFPGKPFTISYVKQQNNIEHKLIHHDPTKGIFTFGFSGKYYNSLSELIQSDPELTNPIQSLTTDYKTYVT